MGERPCREFIAPQTVAIGFDVAHSSHRSLCSRPGWCNWVPDLAPIALGPPRPIGPYGARAVSSKSRQLRVPAISSICSARPVVERPRAFVDSAVNAWVDPPDAALRQASYQIAGTLPLSEGGLALCRLGRSDGVSCRCFGASQRCCGTPRPWLGCVLPNFRKYIRGLSVQALEFGTLLSAVDEGLSELPAA
jgi:hypothetical protein